MTPQPDQNAMDVLAVGGWALLENVAREAGFCLVAFGSLHRDLDVVALPWQPTQNESELIQAFCDYPGVITTDEVDWRGWRCLIVQLGGGRYFDLKIVRLRPDPNVDGAVDAVMGEFDLPERYAERLVACVFRAAGEGR